MGNMNELELYLWCHNLKNINFAFDKDITSFQLNIQLFR